MSDLTFAYKIVWYQNSDGFMGKVVGIPDSEVGADCWEALYDGLVSQVDDYIDELRESTGLPYKGEEIKLTVEQVTEEEFGPLFPDDEWDEEDEEDEE